jgi:hypothetical protein
MAMHVVEDGMPVGPNAIYLMPPKKEMRIKDRYGIDFTHYKPTTVTRRIQRRVDLSGSSDLDDLIMRLSTDPDELNQMYEDLLIGVTQFFRDRDAYEWLQRDVIPKLLEGKSPNDEVRVWSAACATGRIRSRFCCVKWPRSSTNRRRSKSSPPTSIANRSNLPATDSIPPIHWPMSGRGCSIAGSKPKGFNGASCRSCPARSSSRRTTSSRTHRSRRWTWSSAAT